MSLRFFTASLFALTVLALATFAAAAKQTGSNIKADPVAEWQREMHRLTEELLLKAAVLKVELSDDKVNDFFAAVDAVEEGVDAVVTKEEQHDGGAVSIGYLRKRGLARSYHRGQRGVIKKYKGVNATECTPIGSFSTKDTKKVNRRQRNCPSTAWSDAPGMNIAAWTISACFFIAFLALINRANGSIIATILFRLGDETDPNFWLAQGLHEVVELFFSCALIAGGGIPDVVTYFLFGAILFDVVAFLILNYIIGSVTAKERGAWSTVNDGSSRVPDEQLDPTETEIETRLRRRFKAIQPAIFFALDGFSDMLQVLAALFLLNTNKGSATGASPVALVLVIAQALVSFTELTLSGHETAVDFLKVKIRAEYKNAPARLPDVPWMVWTLRGTSLFGYLSLVVFYALCYTSYKRTFYSLCYISCIVAMVLPYLSSSILFEEYGRGHTGTLKAKWTGDATATEPAGGIASTEVTDTEMPRRAARQVRTAIM